MLTTMGIFEEPSRRTFRNNKTSDFLREDKPQNVRAMILMHNSPEMSLPWYEQLEDGVKTGEVPFRLAICLTIMSSVHFSQEQWIVSRP